MEHDIETRRAAALAELKAAFAELETGHGLTRLVGGHGIQSRVFEFEWDEPSLGIRYRLPYARLLQDEATQKEDDEEIGAALRMAMLLLAATGRPDAPSRLEVSCDDHGTSYAIYTPDGDLEDSGTDWSPLVHRLETELGAAPEPLSIIWP
jgi:hypothetical protein